MKKIFIDTFLSINQEFELDGEDHHHLKVIRLNVGDNFRIGDKNFNEYIAEIIGVTHKHYKIKIISKTDDFIISRRKLFLYISLPKKKKFDEIIFKASQLGVEEIIPIETSRTVKHINIEKSDKLYSRWNKKAKSGSELSGRKAIPSISKLLSFFEALEDFRLKNISNGIIFWEDESDTFLSKEDLQDTIAIFIGPEGGFSTEEISMAKDSGLKVRSLGKLVMDVETAAIAASALLLLSV